ncbi:MAG: metallophosphoesterase [Acidobacteria bacterium]|nr:metallophosphoesterase [Acidobacteriota bacterium]
MLRLFSAGQGRDERQTHVPPIAGAGFPVQAARRQPPYFPFQPLPPANGPAPYRFDLSQLLAPDDLEQITATGTLVFHAVGDTGDARGRQQDFVAQMMTHDARCAPDGKKPIFLYHLGDVVYFCGDPDMYGRNFYATYKDYPGFIVAIPGNHDCQPDHSQDGQAVAKKVPLDGWVQNFMSKEPGRIGAPQTAAVRTQVDLPNVYWTMTTPLATIIGLFSNVDENEGEIQDDQLAWFEGELEAADPDLALIVAVHHPPFSGDVEHGGSGAIERALFGGFQAAGRHPDLILSGHVHNYQRFTKEVAGPAGPRQVPCVVAGAGGYTNLAKIHQVDGMYPPVPLPVGDGLTLERYDLDSFGFLRLEVSKTRITGTYLSAPYASGAAPAARVVEAFAVDLLAKTVRTLT